jgi:hypothetical protein
VYDKMLGGDLLLVSSNDNYHDNHTADLCYLPVPFQQRQAANA